MMKTMRYTTREGKTWTVTECAPMPLHPGFFLGFRHTDGEQVMIHEHRCKEVLREGELRVEGQKKEGVMP